ncbi:hypothetical protein ACFPOE_21845 [Caenimonas terrae]|uniref:Uncharacterized protein n=1 Tax=Caenimonas terrae TaxID=696074 RepID=A0ABW0NJL3_9BURK
MPTQDSRKLAGTLERLAAEGDNTTRIADAVVSTWQAIDSALAPVIGGRGVSALYCRSLYLVRERHPWLAAVNGGIGSDMDLGLLAAALAQQDSCTAASAAGDHLQAVYELLRSLIGPALTGQLLRSAWDNPFGGAPAQDRTQ